MPSRTNIISANCVFRAAPFFSGSAINSGRINEQVTSLITSLFVEQPACTRSVRKSEASHIVAKLWDPANISVTPYNQRSLVH